MITLINPVRTRSRASLLLAAACIVAGGSAVAIYALDFRSPDSAQVLAADTRMATRGAFEQIVVRTGELESSKSSEIKCLVRATRPGSRVSTTILDVIPEGTHVKKGDWLLTFDSSELEQLLRDQRIAANRREAAMIEAKAAYDAAIVALEEYEQGIYRSQRAAIKNNIFVAREASRRADLSLQSAERLVSRGLLAPSQLDAAASRLQSAENESSLAQQTLKTLEDYSSARTSIELRSAVTMAEVGYMNAESSYQQELLILEETRQQIANCRVNAPQAGEVVYANVRSRRSDFVVEPGAAVRERQVVLRLPDPSQMQIRTTISESQVNLVREGMGAAIRVDALRDVELQGVVAKINRYAEPTSYWSSSAKEYSVLVRVDNPPPQLRVGMTAEAEIQINRQDDVLTVPLHALFERNRRTFCLVQGEERIDVREVTIDSINEEAAVLDELKSGLKEGEQIVLRVRKYANLIETTPGSDVQYLTVGG